GALWQKRGQKKRAPAHMHRGPKKRRRPTLPLGVAVPSAQTGLTSLFGMERGGPRRHGHLRSSAGASPGNVYIVDIIMGQGVPWKQATERVRVRTLEKKRIFGAPRPKRCGARTAQANGQLVPL